MLSLTVTVLILFLYFKFKKYLILKVEPNLIFETFFIQILGTHS